jgi:hypothetical protein
MIRTTANTQRRLKGFTEPSTGSQFEGYLEPGKYLVQDFKPNHPDRDTDYALLLAPTLGANDTWICTRWKDQHYAQIVESEPTVQEPRVSFDDAPLAIDESALVDRLTDFHDFTYTPDGARYPHSLPGIRLPLSPPAQNNCCTFVEALLVKAWSDSHEDFEWSTGLHGQMMIFSNDDYFSPVTAVVESGMAISVTDSDVAPHPWTLVQGWRHQWRNGHTFIIVDHHAASDRVLTLESNSHYQLNGVGFRAIGNLRDVDVQPPQNWWEMAALWTWDDICATYRYRQQARLKVRNRTWNSSMPL